MEKSVNRSGKTVRIWAVAALLAGLTSSAALIAYHSFASVGEAVWRIGWGLVLIVAVHLTAVVSCGIAWRALFRSGWTADTKLLIILRWVRESVNTLLPVVRIGGDIIGVRLLVTRGTDINLASASVVADRTVEVLSQFLFAVAGVFLFVERDSGNDFLYPVILGLCAIAAVLLIFLAAQRWGLLRAVEKAVQKLAGKCGVDCSNGGMSVHETVWEMYGDYRRLAAATLLHTFGWVLGVVQIWVALYFMGRETGWAEAFIVESLSQVICTAAFIMPAALGAQEAAYMVIGGLFGIPAEIGLALSLVKRLGDVFAGIPGLLVWQGFEGRLLWELSRSR